MGVKKIKISALPLADTLVGLYTIGVNALNKSVKVSLEFLKTAADKANDAATAANKAKTAAETATEAAKTATKNANTATEAANTAAKNATDKATAADTAAKNANTKADAADKAAGAATTAANTANSKAALADQKATAADNAANLAGETAEEARATIVRLEELEESLVGQYKMIPTGMNLDYPPRITFRNTVPRRIHTNCSRRTRDAMCCFSAMIMPFRFNPTEASQSIGQVSAKSTLSRPRIRQFTEPYKLRWRNRNFDE